MFYYASRAGRVGPLNGKVMYGAVYLFGPRWTVSRPGGAKSIMVVQTPAVGQLSSDEDFLRMREFIRLHPQITLDSIERLTRVGLERTVPRLPQRFRGVLSVPTEPGCCLPCRDP